MFITHKRQEMTVLVNRDELQDPYLDQAVQGLDVLHMSVYEVQKRLREIQQNEPVFAALRGRGFTLHHVGPYIDEQKMGHLDIIEFLAIKDETAEPIIVDHQLLTEKGSLS